MVRIVYVELDDGSDLRCFSPPELAIHPGDQCVAQAGEVLEFGHVSRIQEVESVEAEQQKDMPRVLRRATLQDQSKARENALYLKMAEDTCCRKARQQKLDMQIISVRRSFDTRVVTILFTAEERIQFRDLVKELAEELHARIEMKQIGVRDAAGIIGGIGPCGRRLCCECWLRRFDAVGVRMAKTQRLSLNPTTISGMCGRLKCCMRYEYSTYAELARCLPRDGAMVTCPEGRGCVVDKNVLAQQLRVRFEDGRIRDFKADDVTVEDKRQVGEDEDPADGKERPE